jgi:hypothetical protein
MGASRWSTKGDRRPFHLDLEVLVSSGQVVGSTPLGAATQLKIFCRCCELF